MEERDMSEKLDFKRDYKDLYLPGADPVLIEVPPIRAILVDGLGAPESASYQEAMQLLYSLSFTIKMSKMKGKQPQGYRDYVVPPLEGFWDMGERPFDRAAREQWQWTSMIRQPEFVTQPVFDWAVGEASKKKPNLDFSRARLADVEEGLCVQAMHIGPYSEEPATMARLEAYMADHGLVPDHSTQRRHHEIYLSDPRKTAPQRLKTVLRVPVRRG